MQGSGVLDSWLPAWLPSVSSAAVDLDGEPPYSFQLDAGATLEAPQTDSWIDTTGRIQTVPDGFESTGTLAFRPPQPSDGRGRHEIEVEADGDRHRLRGRHVFPEEGVWRSEETAERATVNAVEGLADSVGVEADAELQSHNTDGEEVEIRYTAALAGLERGATETLHRWFGSRREVQETDLGIRRISLDRSTDGGGTRYSWDVEVEDHLSVSASLADSVGWSRAEELAELRRETGFGVEAEWSLYLGDQVDMSLEYEAVNGREYVDKLRSAGVETPPESELHVEIDPSGEGRSTEVRYASDSGSGEQVDLMENLRRWRSMAPAPLLPLISHYVSR